MNQALIKGLARANRFSRMNGKLTMACLYHNLVLDTTRINCCQRCASQWLGTPTPRVGKSTPPSPSFISSV